MKIKPEKNQEKYTNYAACARTHVDMHIQDGMERDCSFWEKQLTNTLILQQIDLQLFEVLKTQENS